MRSLLPADPAGTLDTHAALVAWYARDWAGTGGVRADMVASADGAASVGGASAGLQTPGDNAVFAALRTLADVVVVGSATAQAEDYGPVRVSALDRELRAAHGLAAEPRVAVVTRTAELDLSRRLWSSGPRPLVLTVAAADEARRRAAARVADVVVCGDTEPDPVEARRVLRELGLPHVLTEGGPTVLARFVAAGALDELCLSVTPLLAGPGAGRVLAGAPLGTTVPLTLTGLLEDGGALFARYRLIR